MSAPDPSAGWPQAPLAPWLQSQLRQLLSQRGHAVLLAGPSGLGQYELAMALARAWLCEAPTADGACGRCGSCHAVQVRTHADLLVLMPETLSLALGWPIEPSAQKDIDQKKRKPSQQIRMEAARQAVSFTQFTRSRGSTKVIVVYPAQCLNPQAASALLKTLEEPAGQVRFVLATEDMHHILPTISSRCQTHAMHWPTAEQALPWLQTQAMGVRAPGAPAPTLELAQVWWQAAGARPADALDYARSGLTAQTWQALPQALARSDWALLSQWPAERQLAVLQQLCHDLMAVAAGAAPRFFPASALPKALPSWPQLAAWARELMDAARTVDHPFHAALMQEAWAARMQEAWAARAAQILKTQP